MHVSGLVVVETVGITRPGNGLDDQAEWVLRSGLSFHLFLLNVSSVGCGFRGNEELLRFCGLELGFSGLCLS